MRQGRRTGLRRTAAAGLLISSVAVVAVVGKPAVAQDGARGGPLFTFGISTTIRASDNLDLEVVSPGTTIVSETRLTFGFQSVTRTQDFSVQFSDTFEFGSGPHAPDSAGFKRPEFALSYSWEGKNAEFDFDASLTEIDLADSIDNVEGSGSRVNRDVSLRFETGLNDPFGAELILSRAEEDFQDTTSPTLTDSDTTNANAALIFRPNQTTETRLTYGYSFADFDDVLGRERTTRAIGISARIDLDPVSQLSGSIGWNVISEKWTAPALPAVIVLPDRESGVASLRYTRILPAGELALAFDYSLTVVGERADFLFSRGFALPKGVLAFDAGLTQIDDNDVQVVGGLRYLREWPDQAFRINLSSEIIVRNIDTVERKTLASVGYEYQINEIESVDFGLSYSAETNAGGQDIAEGSKITASAIYRRSLTRDWLLETGYLHRITFEEDVDTARSNEVFLRLERGFSWRP
ncbi:MAG: hypothetical protein AAGA70_15790 [Pseudomonadota bacterium]